MKPGDVVVTLVRKNGRACADGTGWWVVKEVFRPKPILGAPARDGYVRLAGYGNDREHLEVFVSPKRVRRIPAKVIEKELLAIKRSLKEAAKARKRRAK